MLQVLHSVVCLLEHLGVDDVLAEVAPLVIGRGAAILVIVIVIMVS